MPERARAARRNPVAPAAATETAADQPGEGVALQGRELVVGREDRNPVECRICGRRNYAIGDRDRRHALFIIAATPCPELRALYLCSDHLRELKQKLAAIPDS